MKQLTDALALQGFECTPVFTGEIQRFNRHGKYLAGWFEGYEVKGPSGPIYKARYGDWATGEKYFWSSDAGTTYSKEDLETLQKELAKVEEARAKKKDREQRAAAVLAQELWDKAGPAKPDHAYLVKKKIGAGGLKQLEHELVIPIVNGDSLVSLQFIDEKGLKRFLAGGRLKGSYHIIPGDTSLPTHIVEGWSTGMSVHLATNAVVVVAMNTAGMVSYAEAQEPGYGVPLVIAADNDSATKRNPGITAANKASKILQSKGYRVIIRSPNFPANSGLTDWNDIHVNYGLNAVTEGILTKGTTSEVAKTNKTGSLKDLYQEKIESLRWPVNAKGQAVPPSQNQVALALAELYEDVLIREVEDVFLWTGDHWEELEQKNFKRFIRDRAQILMSGAASDKDLNAYHNILMDKLPRVPDGMSFYQQLPNLANFLDGTLEITREKRTGKYTMKFREHSRADLLTQVIPFRYQDPRPANPLFERWLKDSFHGDSDAAGKLRALKQIGGASLISLFPRIAFLYGVPGTGKSTFAKLCMRFMGAGNYSSVEPKHQDGFLKETMINKQANIVTDISDAMIDPAQWKRVEDRVPELINRKNKRAILGYLPALHLYCGNTLPKGIDGATSAFDRRITIVAWKNSVVVGDLHTREYEDLILEAGPGAVLQFFLEGLEDLIQCGGIYFNPESGKQRLASWKMQNDMAGQFLEALEHGEIGPVNAPLQLDPKGRITRGVLTDAFKKWLDRPAPTALIHMTLEELDRRGYAVRKSNGVRYVYGISVPGTSDPGAGVADRADEGGSKF